MEDDGWENISYSSYSLNIVLSDYYLFRSLQNHLDELLLKVYGKVEFTHSTFFSSRPTGFYKNGIPHIGNGKKNANDDDGIRVNEHISN